MRPPRTRWTFLVLFVLSMLYALPTVGKPLGPYDEAIILTGADRILAGEVPYRDFWAIYAPGQGYAIAGLFLVFGKSVLVGRVYHMVLVSLISLLVFAIVRRATSFWTALIGWGGSLVWAEAVGLPGYPAHAAVVAILAGLHLLTPVASTRPLARLAVAGAMFGLASVIRHDMAGLVTFGVLLYLALAPEHEPAGEASVRASRFRRSLVRVAAFVGGVAAVASPVYLFLLVKVGPATLCDDLIRIPATVYPAYRQLPYPGLAFSSLPFYLGPLVLAVGLGAAGWSILRGGLRALAAGAGALLLLSLTGGLLLNQVVARSDMLHLFAAGIFAIAIAAVLFGAALRRWRGPVARWIAVGALALGAVGMLGLTPAEYAKGWAHLGKVASAVAGGETHTHAVLSAPLREVVAHIDANTDPEDAIYVGVSDHDLFLINDLVVYFLTQRRYATKYHELHPGVTSTEDVQREIVTELSAQEVELVILAPRFWFEPNQSCLSSEVDVLDTYIRENFERTRSFDPYEVWERRK